MFNCLTWPPSAIQILPVTKCDFLEAKNNDGKVDGHEATFSTEFAKFFIAALVNFALGYFLEVPPLNTKLNQEI